MKDKRDGEDAEGAANALKHGAKSHNGGYFVRHQFDARVIGRRVRDSCSDAADKYQRRDYPDDSKRDTGSAQAGEAEAEKDRADRDDGETEGDGPPVAAPLEQETCDRRKRKSSPPSGE